MQLDKKRIASGACQAIIVNSGNANCCTGEKGMQDAIRLSQLAASGLGIPDDLVLVASTGVIGQYLAMDKIETAVPSLVKSLHGDGIAEPRRFDRPSGRFPARPPEVGGLGADDLLGMPAHRIGARLRIHLLDISQHPDSGLPKLQVQVGGKGPLKDFSYFLGIVRQKEVENHRKIRLDPYNQCHQSAANHPSRLDLMHLHFANTLSLPGAP